MSLGYSDDLRIRVVRAVDNGLSRRGAASRFSVGVSSAIRWPALWQSEGIVRAEPGKKNCRLKLSPHKDWLLALIKETPDLTLEEIRKQLFEKHAMTCSVSSVWRFFDTHGISFKKNDTR